MTSSGIGESKYVDIGTGKFSRMTNVNLGIKTEPTPLRMTAEYATKLDMIVQYTGLTRAAFLGQVVKEAIDYHYYLLQKDMGVKDIT